MELDQLRLLIADTDPFDQVLSDESLLELLDLNQGNVRLAAADALDAIAVSETLVSKVIRTQDLSTNGPAVADSLRKQADRLRAQVTAGDADDILDVTYLGDIATEWPERTAPLVEVWGL